MKTGKIMIGLAAGFALGGCAVVESTPHRLEDGKTPSGFTYFLPRVMLKVEAKRAEVTSEKVQAAKDKAASTGKALAGAKEAKEKATQSYISKKSTYDDAVKSADFDEDVRKALNNGVKGVDAAPECVPLTTNYIFDPAERSSQITVNTNVLAPFGIAIAITKNASSARMNIERAIKDIEDIEKAGIDKTILETNSKGALVDAEQKLKVIKNQLKASRAVIAAYEIATDHQAPVHNAAGLYYRRPVAYQIDVLESSRVLQSARVALPNGGPVAVAPMTAGGFVTTGRSASFKDGILISNQATRPSEIEGLLKIPAGIIKAIFGGGETE